MNIRSLFDLINILRRKQKEVTADIETNTACCTTDADDISTNADAIATLEDTPSGSRGIITAGEALSANDAVYIAHVYHPSFTAGAVYKADVDVAARSTETARIGFATAAATSDADVTIQFDGILDGFSGLIAGRTYYLSSTAGAITADATSQQSIGVAVSATELLINLVPTSSWLGFGRVLFAGGWHTGGLSLDYPPIYQNVIEYVTIATAGNATDFGDLTVARSRAKGVSSQSRGIFCGGLGPTGWPTGDKDVIDYVTIATLGNAIDFGDLTLGRKDAAACSSATRGVIGGGTRGAPATAYNIIDYVTIATLGDATDFGDLLAAASAAAGCSSPTRGIFGGGGRTGTSDKRVIEYVTIATLGNSINFGNLTAGGLSPGGRYDLAACSSTTRGIFAGGQSGIGNTNIIDYITIATTGDATDFGDLSAINERLAGASSLITGIFGGGTGASGTFVNTIDQITIATTGNAVDFGDLTAAKREPGACSDAHGGLG